MPEGALPQPSPYDSDEISTFFTSVVGTPCNLARYPQLQKSAPNANSHSTRRLSLQSSNNANARIARSAPMRNSLTMTTQSNKLCGGNIILSEDVFYQDIAYVQIGHHYYEIVKPKGARKSSIGGNTELTHLRYLRNIFDGSPAAQNPTVQAGDPVKTFSTLDALLDLGLRACVASTYASNYICPVRSCLKEANSKEKFEQHLLLHASAKASYVDVISEKARGISQTRRKGKTVVPASRHFRLQAMEAGKKAVLSLHAYLSHCAAARTDVWPGRRVGGGVANYRNSRYLSISA
jgi:hypothetical protein